MDDLSDIRDTLYGLNEAPICLYKDCEERVIIRKAISHLFGRNKGCTRSIPKPVWVHICRKHYQRTRYHQGDGYAKVQASLVRMQLDRIQAWSDANQRAGRAGVLESYAMVLRKRETARIARTADPDQAEDNAVLSGTAVPNWLRVKCKTGYSTQDVKNIINQIEAAVEREELQQIPDIEFLATISKSDGPARRGKRKNDRADTSDDSDDQASVSTRRPRRQRIEARSEATTATATLQATPTQRTPSSSLQGPVAGGLTMRANVTGFLPTQNMPERTAPGFMGTQGMAERPIPRLMTTPALPERPAPGFMAAQNAPMIHSSPLPPIHPHRPHAARQSRDRRLVLTSPSRMAYNRHYTGAGNAHHMSSPLGSGPSTNPSIRHLIDGPGFHGSLSAGQSMMGMPQPNQLHGQGFHAGPDMYPWLQRQAVPARGAQTGAMRDGSEFKLQESEFATEDEVADVMREVLRDEYHHGI